MPPTDAELVGKLMDASENGRVNWQKTAVTDQYAAAFGGKWTVTIDKSTVDNEDYYWLSINNAEGEEILKIFGSEDKRVERLFEVARRHALRVNEAIKDLIKELDESSN